MGRTKQNARTFATRAILCTTLASTMTASLGAQSVLPDSATIPDHQLFHQSDLLVAGAFVVGTILLLPADRQLTSTFRSEHLLANRNVERVANAGSFFGGSGPTLIGPAMYVAGRLARQPKLAELGLHGTEAVLVGKGVADVIKLLAGRARPYASLDTNAHDFSFGRGSSRDRKSFPSGHATAAFSAAAAVVAETREWWPNSVWYVAPVMYGGATLVGASRIYNEQHWASDVLMGAAIGTFAGLKVVRFNHTHTGNKLDKILLGVRAVPTANGTALTINAEF